MDNILIVDDDKNMLEVLKFRLEEEGYRIATTTGAHDALKRVENELFVPGCCRSQTIRKGRRY